MADSIPYLAPTQFQELILPHITRPKILAQVFFLVSGKQLRHFFYLITWRGAILFCILKAAAFDVGYMKVH